MRKLQIAFLAIIFIAGNVKAEKWQMNQKDIWHTGRADYKVRMSLLSLKLD